MRKLILLFLVFLLTSTAWASDPYMNQRPGEWYGQPSMFFRNTANQIVTVMDAVGFRLPVDVGTISISIGSVTVSVFPVYADLAGNPATASVDVDHRVLTNLGSETIGLMAALASMSNMMALSVKVTMVQPSTFSQGVLGLSGASPVAISPISNQIRIRITRIGQDTADYPIYVSKGELATYGQGIEVWGSFVREWGYATAAVISSGPATLSIELEAE